MFENARKQPSPQNIIGNFLEFSYNKCMEKTVSLIPEHGAEVLGIDGAMVRNLF